MNNRDRDQHLAYHAKGEWTRNADGLYTWNTSGNPIPTEILQTWAAEGLITDLDTALAARSKEMDAFFARYRAARAAGPTAEERFEALAAHGPGVTLVDVVTGARWTT